MSIFSTTRFSLALFLFVALFMAGLVAQCFRDRCTEIITGRYVD